MECLCKLKEEQLTCDLHMQGHVQPLIVLDIIKLNGTSGYLIYKNI